MALPLPRCSHVPSACSLMFSMHTEVLTSPHAGDDPSSNPNPFRIGPRGLVAGAEWVLWVLCIFSPHP